MERADGSRATREIAGHPGAVTIVAIDDQDRVLLVRQYRMAVGELLLELPAGTLEVADDGTTEDPAIAARRELEEETGMRAGSWRFLTRFYTTPGFTSEDMYLYLATDLVPAHGDQLGPDEDERLLLERIPFETALAYVEQGEIVDAKSIVGLFWIERMRREGAIEHEVAPVEAEPGADAISVDFAMTTREQVLANLVLYQRSKGSWAIGLFGLLAGGLSALNGEWVTAVVLLVLAALVASGLIAVPFVLWFARKRPDLVQAQITFTADGEGVTYASPTGVAQLEWQTYRRVRDAGGFFFLDTGAGLNQVVPRRAFSSSQLGIFYRLVERAGLLGGRAAGPAVPPTIPNADPGSRRVEAVDELRVRALHRALWRDEIQAQKIERLPFPLTPRERIEPR